MQRFTISLRKITTDVRSKQPKRNGKVVTTPKLTQANNIGVFFSIQVLEHWVRALRA